MPFKPHGAVDRFHQLNKQTKIEEIECNLAGGFDAIFKLKFVWPDVQLSICCIFCIPHGARWTILTLWWIAYFQMINDCIKVNRQTQCCPFCFSFFLYLLRRRNFGCWKQNSFRHSQMDYFQCGSNIRSQSSNHLAPLQLSKVHCIKVWCRAYINRTHTQSNSRSDQWPDDLLIKTVFILLRFHIAMKKEFFVSVFGSSLNFGFWQVLNKWRLWKWTSTPQRNNKKKQKRKQQTFQNYCFNHFKIN